MKVKSSVKIIKGTGKNKEHLSFEDFERLMKHSSYSRHKGALREDR